MDSSPILKSKSNFVNAPKMMTFTVGQTQKAFTVHEFLLQEVSDRFSTAIQSQSLDAMLANEDPDIFGFVVHWLYQQKGKQFVSTPWDEDQPALKTYFGIWMFAGLYEITELRHYVMRQIHAWRMEGGEVPSMMCSALQHIFSGQEFHKTIDWNTETSALAAWAIDFCIYSPGFMDYVGECDETYLLPTKVHVSILEESGGGKIQASGQLCVGEQLA